MHPRDRLDSILRKEYGKGMVEIAKALQYSQQNIEFLSVDLQDATACASLMDKHKSLIDTMKVSTSYKNRMDRGTRLPVSMFANLVQGWITEDLTVLMLRDAGFEVELSGIDKDRNIYNVNVACEPDILIKHGDKKQWVELATEYTDYGMDGDRPFFELRKTKFVRCYEHKAFVLYRNLSIGKYILVDLSRGKTIVHKIPKKEWNVYSMRYYFDENHMEMRPLDRLVDELRAALDGIGETEKAELEVIDEMPKTVDVPKHADFAHSEQKVVHQIATVKESPQAETKKIVTPIKKPISRSAIEIADDFF